MLALVFVPGLGKEVGGGTRWINLGPLSFQPIEVSKCVPGGRRCPGIPWEPRKRWQEACPRPHLPRAAGVGTGLRTK